MKNLLVLIICTVFLTGCNIGKLVTEFIDILPLITQKFDETVKPAWSKLKNIFDGDEVATVVQKSDGSFIIRNLSIQGSKAITRICDDEGYNACEEISSWKIPEGSFENEPTYEDKIAYHLSCVAIVNTGKSLGTGFFVEQNKLITNEHVVEQNEEVEIIQFLDYLSMSEKGETPEEYLSAEELLGKVIRKSERNDIAVITTNKPNATTCIIADTSPEILGDVVTVGHPLELFYTVSKGSINAYRDRKQDFMANKDSMRVYSIHMDAPIYPGNSGGPLFYKGKVIGVNTFKYEDTTLNFSIHHNIFTRYLN